MDGLAVIEARAGIWDALLGLIGLDARRRCACGEALIERGGECCIVMSCPACDRRGPGAAANAGAGGGAGGALLVVEQSMRAEVPRITRTAAERGIEKVLL